MTLPSGTRALPGCWRYRRTVSVFALCACAVACGSGSPPPEPSHPGVTKSRSSLPGRTARASLWRDEVVAVVKQGLGRFLQLVDLEPSFDAGRFQGFRIVALREARFWQEVDLKPGDVVLSVNSMPIERETQAYDAFQSLKTAAELRVDYLRDGARRALVYKIVQRPKRGG